MYTRFFKRALDIVLVVSLTPFLLPVFFIIILLLAIDNKGDVFFNQSRPGKGGQLFTLHKFKTMQEPSLKYTSDNERITALGTILRKSSLDELPQFLNILKGEMSFIGPRPLLPEYLPLYSEKQLQRHAVLPGITGWAQVKGRNSISWGERFELDYYYVTHLSWWLDFKILCLTPIKLFSNSDVYTKEQQLMEKFNGNN